MMTVRTKEAIQMEEALVEKGWEVAFSVEEDGSEALMGIGGPGRRYGVGPSWDEPFILMDFRSRRGACCFVSFLPTPDRAAELLAQHGISRKELHPYAIRGTHPPVVPEDA